MPTPTISAGYPRALLDFTVSKGAGRQDLIARAGLDSAQLQAQDNRVPLDRYLALFQAAIDLTGEPGLALQFGQAVRMQDISIVGLICEACEVAADVGPQLNRLARLVVDEDRGAPSDLIGGRRDAEGLWITGPNPVYEQSLHMVEAEMARLVWNARVMFAETPFFQTRPFPRAIRFTHLDPGYRAEYDRIFGCPVSFGCPVNELLTDPEFLQLRQPPTNRYVFGVLSERAEALLKSLDDAKTTRARVESLLIPLLHRDDLRMETIAAALGLSRATLLRRLKAEGLTFGELLDDLKRRMALRYLHDRKVSIGETAYLVGFSDRAAFSRAFKRWTGASPGRWNPS